jgi:hypothetical protein
MNEPIVVLAETMTLSLRLENMKRHSCYTDVLRRYDHEVSLSICVYVHSFLDVPQALSQAEPDAYAGHHHLRRGAPTQECWRH